MEQEQNLQRDYLTTLYNISSTLLSQPDATSSYEDLREHLDAHCNRVYNGEILLALEAAMRARICNADKVPVPWNGRHMRMAVYAALQPGKVFVIPDATRK